MAATKTRVPGRVEVFRAEDGWRWTLRASNGSVVADGGESYTRRHDAVKAARRCFDPEWPLRLRVKTAAGDIEREVDSLL